MADIAGHTLMLVGALLALAGIVAWLRSIADEREPPWEPDPEEQDEGVHAYRPAISRFCRIGTCSLNNCIFPHCEEPPPAPKKK